MAKIAIALFKEWDNLRFDTMMIAKHRPDVRYDVARVAVLATASLTEVKSCGWNICPPDYMMVETFKKLRPDWLDAWIAHMLDDSPLNFNRVHSLWDSGLCEKPDSEVYILALMVAPRFSHWPDNSTPDSPANRQAHDTLANRLTNRPDLYPDIWRFFEVEGYGEFSLAAFDKYNPTEQTWATALRELSERGLLDRGRLLDASLDALARDFAQFRASWYSRFYEAMKPTLEEQVARKGQFLQLLGSAIPPTVSLALKAIKQVDKAKPFAGPELLDAIAPVLQARQKGTITAGLRLIESATKRAPGIREQALSVVLGALIHESADVQGKALDLLEKLSVADNPAMLESLEDYADGVAPSLRPRVAALCGTKTVVAQVTPTAAKRDPVKLHPVDGYDAFVSEFLGVLEDTSDPFRIERVIDGLARYGSDMPSDFDRVIGPLAKRAKQILMSSGETTLRQALAHLVQCYASRSPLTLPDRMLFGSEVSLGTSYRKTNLGAQGFVLIFIKRSMDILGQVQKGHRLPLLCAPTDTRGFVAADVLANRMKVYEDAKVAPGPYDLSLALMRLAPEGRKPVLAAQKLDTEISRALGFALGGDLNIGRFNIGKTKWLWVAAAAARVPLTDEPRIAGIAGFKAPDVGIRAQYEVLMSVRKYETYSFPEIEVKTSPSVAKSLPDKYLTGLFHLTTAGNYGGSVCGHNANDVRWSSFVWPLNLEPFFSQGVDIFDPDQKLSNTPYAAFVEPMLMPHVKVGAMGATLLSQAIASTDPAVRSVAAEALILAIEENRVDTDLLARATRDLIMKARLPVARWTRGFGDIVKVSPRHAAYICDLITGLMRFDPASPPRNIGGLVELLFELHVETGRQLTDAEARACLSSVSAGGKLAKFARMLLSL